MNEQAGVYQKCTFFAHLFYEGWEQPRCAHACPLEALRMVTLEPEEMEAGIAAEDLEPAHPDLNATGPSVFYRNLYRYNKCFLGGAVISGEGEEEACLEGCTVSLKKDGKLLDTQVTDAFGAFKFDRLDPGSGTYRVEAAAEGFLPAAAEAKLGESTYIGLLRLGKSK
jgi:Fe-S-cluster-containing hydrogenase component 2